MRYSRDIRPLISDRCGQCHGADPGSLEANLRLDERESALRDRGGYAVLVPGEPEESELWWRLIETDPDVAMPPPSAKKPPFTAAELELLRRWIAEGAEYEPHWAFVAPERPPLPAPPPSLDAAVGAAGADWASNPIDRFVLARLATEDLAPSPPAAPAELLRRVHLDLCGLPPSVAELDTFLAEVEATGLDTAYAAAVERLFAEEPGRTRLAEHLATPWLDAARYADTIGIHTDNGHQAWLWRDWVLEALRDNLPYDEFVTRQLAGDLLPDATTADRVATGFHRNHVVTDEGGAIDEEYLVEYAVDRVSTTGSVFLGLTLGCARCHDHKYDPVSQADFFGLFAFFNSNDEPGLYSQTGDPNRAYEPFLGVPSPEQAAEEAELEANLVEYLRRLAEPLPGAEERRAEFLVQAAADAGVDWTLPEVLTAESSDERVALVPQQDGSVLAAGPMPPFEDYTVTLRTEATDLRAVLLEALLAGGESQGAGRAAHSNAVVSGLTLEVRPAGDTAGDWTRVPFTWGWSDHTQQNGDFEPPNLFDADDPRGWTVDGNDNAGERDLLLVTAEPFGFAGGTELRVTLFQRSQYERHSLGRVRLRVSPLQITSTLPVALGRWYAAGPFRPPAGADRLAGYDLAFGPESSEGFDTGADFGSDHPSWALRTDFVDGAVAGLPDGIGVTYVGRELWAPDARELEIAFGSDDGYQLYLNGALVSELRTDRGAEDDQNRARLALVPGRNTLVLKTINTGGQGGFAFRALEADHVLAGELPSALLPRDAVHTEQLEQEREAWRRRFDPEYRALDDARLAAEARQAELAGEIPRAMVMRELPEPRETFLLMRGVYDAPDTTQPTPRAVPAFLPPFPEDAPLDRLGLARWMFAPENPLVARVAVNRFWQHLFGAGLVRTSDDFGLQGEWPSHPELLDWLAVEFRESGWDVHALLRQIVLSSTYRQGSRLREELLERDPTGRLLAAYPRRRLGAEAIRDLALATSGLLVEELGGPSVKPYQPDGLWTEVAMLASNTREFERGDGADLYRRSLYTYWKRAVPPPVLQALDAPTRESCVARRQSTNTPLQALALWNDVQFVEASRRLATRVLEEDTGADDAERITWLWRTCTAREPEADERAAIEATLVAFRERFGAAPADAAALLQVGEAPVTGPVGYAPYMESGMEPSTDDPHPALSPDTAAELAAWTMIASAALNLHETLTQH